MRSKRKLQQIEDYGQREAMTDAELARASSGNKHTYNQVARELGLPVEPGEDEWEPMDVHVVEGQPDLALIDEREEDED